MEVFLLSHASGKLMNLTHRLYIIRFSLRCWGWTLIPVHVIRAFWLNVFRHWNCCSFNFWDYDFMSLVPYALGYRGVTTLLFSLHPSRCFWQSCPQNSVDLILYWGKTMFCFYSLHTRLPRQTDGVLTISDRQTIRCAGGYDVTKQDKLVRWFDKVPQTIPFTTTWVYDFRSFVKD